MTQAAEIAAAGKSTIRDWIKSGHLTERWGYRGSRRERRVDRQELRTLLNTHRAEGAEGTAHTVRSADTAPADNGAERTDLTVRTVPFVLSMAALETLRGALIAQGKLEALEAERDRILEENRALRGELDQAQRRIQELERIPFVPQIAAVGRLLRGNHLNLNAAPDIAATEVAARSRGR